MNAAEWIAYLDGESSPQVQDEIERNLLRDPAALAAFRSLCRQRLMLAEALRGAAVPPRRATFRFRWQIAAATLLFAGTVAAVWMQGGRTPEIRILTGKAFVARAFAETPVDSTAELALPDGSAVTLLPSSRALFHTVPGSSRRIIEVIRGTARIMAPKGDGELRVTSMVANMSVRGAGFSVELVPGLNRGGKSMETLLALVVSALVGDVQVDSAGKHHVVAAGEVRVIGADGAVAKSLPEFIALQEKDKEKDGDKDEKEGKEKKGKKKGDKKDKKEKDDDDKEEKDGKDKDKGKKDKDN